MNHYSGLRRLSARAEGECQFKETSEETALGRLESTGDDEIAKRLAKVDNDVRFFQGRGSAHASTRYTLVTYVDEIEMG